MQRKPPLKLLTTTLWEYSSQDYGREAHGDKDYVGATPAWIIWQLLQRYITNPLMPEVRAAVMAADVLMGHDPDCSRWILANRTPVPEGEVSRRRVNRRAVARVV